MKLKSYIIVLILLNFLSVFFILQIELEIFSLFNSNYDARLANKINNLVTNVSLGRTELKNK